MRARIVGTAFVIGLVAVGVAVAGANGNWSTHADGSQEVPARETNAQAQAIFNLSQDGQELDFKLIASNIENVVQAHIHQGAAGANGPIGVFLYGLVPANGGRTDGVLSQGTIVEDDLIGPFEDLTVSELAELLNSGGAYVNVHTSTGSATLGPGNFPGGEVRGQIK